MTCLYFPLYLPQFFEILTNLVPIHDFTNVLFLLAEEAEPLLAILLFPILVAHGNASSFTRAGRDGRHRHGTAEGLWSSRRVS